MEAVFVGLEHGIYGRVDKWTSINKRFRVVDDCARYSSFSLRFRSSLDRGSVISFRSTGG